MPKLLIPLVITKLCNKVLETSVNSNKVPEQIKIKVLNLFILLQSNGLFILDYYMNEFI